MAHPRRLLLALALASCLALPALPAAAAHAPTQPVTQNRTQQRAPTYTVTHGLYPQRLGANAAAACGWVHVVSDQPGVIDFLYTNYCVNGWQSVGYGTGGTCTNYLPGGRCLYQRYGDNGNYSYTAAAWGAFYANCGWFFSCSEELVVWIHGNGYINVTAWGI